MRRRGIVQTVSKGIPDENLVQDNTNITAQFPNANNTGIDSTGNVLTATADNGEAISIFKTQDIGQSDFTALTSDIIPFEGKFEFANISTSTVIDQITATSTLSLDDPIALVKLDNSIVEAVITNNSSPYTYTPTIGEIPLKVYAVDAKASFELSGGFVEAEADSDIYTFANAGSNTSINDIFGDGSVLETYQMNGNMNSVSGLNDATGILSTYSVGKFGQAGDFPAINDAMLTGINWNTIAGVSMWINSPNVLLSQYIIGIEGIATASNSRVRIDAGKIEPNINGITKTSTTTILSNNTWHHIVAFEEAGNISVFVDKVLQIGTQGGSFVQCVDNIAINQYRSNIVPKVCKTDQIRLLTRGIVQSEVDALYEEGAEKFSTTRTYKDLIDTVGSQTVRTKVNLKTKDDKMTELKATLNKRN